MQPLLNSHNIYDMAKLENIANFRDVNHYCPSVQPGRLFRSGHTLFATDNDVDRLMDEFGIRTVIDLRSDGDDEVKSMLGLPDATNRLVDRLEILPLDLAISSSRQTKPFVTRVPFGGAQQMMSYIWHKGTYMELILILLYSIFCMKQRVVEVMWTILSRGGLAGIGCGQTLMSYSPVVRLMCFSAIALVTRSGHLIAKVLKVVALNSQNAMLVHCSLGKDRTGIVIALILMILDVDLEDIVKDYEESGNATTVEMRMALLPSILFDRKQFAKADGQVIRYLANFIKEQYGSLNGYLDSIGFDESYRQMMRTNLLNKTKTKQ